MHPSAAIESVNDFDGYILGSGNGNDSDVYTLMVFGAEKNEASAMVSKDYWDELPEGTDVFLVNKSGKYLWFPWERFNLKLVGHQDDIGIEFFTWKEPATQS